MVVWEGALLKIRLQDGQLPLHATIMVKLMSTKNVRIAYDFPKKITKKQMQTKRKKRKRRMRERGRRKMELKIKIKNLHSKDSIKRVKSQSTTGRRYLQHTKDSYPEHIKSS